MIASYGQGDKDSVKLSISDYGIFCECCIRQTHLEKDTTTLGSQVRDYKLLDFKSQQQIQNLNLQNSNLQAQTINLTAGLKLVDKDLLKQRRINKRIRLGSFTIGPAAIIGGALIGYHLKK